jgi:hypothetical protein
VPRSSTPPSAWSSQSSRKPRSTGAARLTGKNYAEHWDAAFLNRLDLEAHADALKRFWPSGGPHWDALAVVCLPDDAAPGDM